VRFKRLVANNRVELLLEVAVAVTRAVGKILLEVVEDDDEGLAQFDEGLVAIRGQFMDSALCDFVNVGRAINDWQGRGLADLAHHLEPWIAAPASADDDGGAVPAHWGRYGFLEPPLALRGPFGQRTREADVQE
jgi:hypothetical protein